MIRNDGAFLAAGVVALLGLVAATSHSSVWAPSGEGSVPLVELAVVVAAVFLVGSALLGTGGVVLQRMRAGESSRAPHLAQGAPLGIVALTLLSILVISRLELREIVPPPGPAVVDSRPPGPERDRLDMDWGGSAVRTPAEIEVPDGSAQALVEDRVLLLWLAVLMGVVAAGVIVAVRWLRRPEPPASTNDPSAGPGREEAREAVERSIDAMLADPHPGTAIIGAYARLLEELSARRAQRRAYEGPMEHLVRILSVLDVAPAPLEKLIRLFERARFSTHTLTNRHREQALDALREVAAELGAPSVTPTAGRPS